MDFGFGKESCWSFWRHTSTRHREQDEFNRDSGLRRKKNLRDACLFVLLMRLQSLRDGYGEINLTYLGFGVSCLFLAWRSFLAFICKAKSKVPCLGRLQYMSFLNWIVPLLHASGAWAFRCFAHPSFTSVDWFLCGLCLDRTVYGNEMYLFSYAHMSIPRVSRGVKYLA
jgi:hypothetical protein